MPRLPEDDDRDALDRLLGGSPDASHAMDDPVADAFLPPSDPSTATDPVSSTMPVAGPRPDPAPAQSSTQPSVFQGFTPRHAMEGFDFNREQNTGRSAKDAFAYLSNQAPPPPINDKNALAQWFTQYIRPGMEQLGHHVTDVNGDTFRFNNWQGDFTVDYGRGAGADGGALAWQVDPGTAVQPDNPSYQPQGGGGVSPVAPPTMPLTGGQNDQPQGDQTAMDEILREIEALMSGQGSPMDARALQGLLQ